MTTRTKTEAKPSRVEFNEDKFVYYGEDPDTNSEVWELDLSCGCVLVWLSKSDLMNPTAWLYRCAGSGGGQHKFSSNQAKNKKTLSEAAMRRFEHAEHLAD